jgi:hypothetical protein
MSKVSVIRRCIRPRPPEFDTKTPKSAIFGIAPQ